MWTRLSPATNYTFAVAACNGFTRECGPLSNEVTAQTEDGVAGRPKAVQVACRHDNISGMNYVEVRNYLFRAKRIGAEIVACHLKSATFSKQRSRQQVKWEPPTKRNGQIEFYNIKLEGSANFLDADGSIREDTFGPEIKTEDSSGEETVAAALRTRFDFLKPNTNYTVDICAVTRRKECGDRSGSSCKMRETPPRAEHLNRFQWYSDSKGGRPVFRLRYRQK